jgi:hypothetical protein
MEQEHPAKAAAEVFNLGLFTESGGFVKRRPVPPGR